MPKIDQAKEILNAFGLPEVQQNERSALTLLALANITKKSRWSKIERPLLRTVDIMKFMAMRFQKIYAPNSRETIRRQTLHQFEQARIIDRNPDDSDRATNSGNTVYQLTEDAAAVIRVFGTHAFGTAAADFIGRSGSLRESYERRRQSSGTPLKLASGVTVNLSPGSHNRLQVAVIEDFAPRFAPGSLLLYVGDTASKQVVFDAASIAELLIPVTRHDKLPDIILYWQQRNWLFLIEAVTSHGPVSPKRHRELEQLLQHCPAERIYVTTFLDSKTFRKFAGSIAWETEVWIAETPDHMIHFNGPKFLGPQVQVDR